MGAAAAGGGSGGGGRRRRAPHRRGAGQRGQRPQSAGERPRRGPSRLRQGPRGGLGRGPHRRRRRLDPGAAARRGHQEDLPGPPISAGEQRASVPCRGERRTRSGRSSPCYGRGGCRAGRGGLRRWHAEAARSGGRPGRRLCDGVAQRYSRGDTGGNCRGRARSTGALLVRRRRRRGEANTGEEAPSRALPGSGSRANRGGRG